jgi:hypothetical protein
MHATLAAVLALATTPDGFAVGQLADKVHTMTGHTDYTASISLTVFPAVLLSRFRLPGTGVGWPEPARRPGLGQLLHRRRCAGRHEIRRDVRP